MGNKFLKYIFNRIQRQNYRGYHLSQHNRLPFEKVCHILDSIYKVIGEREIRIHVGDWRGRRQHCSEYYNIIDEINKTGNFQCTVNSLKKNIFPDLETMGFLERFDKNHSLVTQGRRGIYYIKLSSFAVNFIKEGSLLKKYKDYILSVEKLMEPILEELFIILFKYFDSINIYEYTFILSDPQLKQTEKIDLVKSYRRLKKIEQTRLILKIKKEFEKINQKAKNKREKRDFMNWYNESLQVFNLLNQTIYFKTFRKTILMLSISQEVLEFIATRSQREKELYFEFHRVNKKAGYHLHHIYPISYATSRKDLELIDNHKNLIYITSNVHPQIKDTYVALIYKDDRLYLGDPLSGDKIDITDECLINKNNISKMIKYNSILLKNVS